MELKGIPGTVEFVAILIRLTERPGSSQRGSSRHAPFRSPVPARGTNGGGTCPAPNRLELLTWVSRYDEFVHLYDVVEPMQTIPEGDRILQNAIQADARNTQK